MSSCFWKVCKAKSTWKVVFEKFIKQKVHEPLRGEGDDWTVLVQIERSQWVLGWAMRRWSWSIYNANAESVSVCNENHHSTKNMYVSLSVCLHFSRIFLLYSPQPPQHALGDTNNHHFLSWGHAWDAKNHHLGNSRTSSQITSNFLRDAVIYVLADFVR